MGEVHMAQGSPLIHTSFEAPARNELHLHESVAIATRHGGGPHRDRHRLIRVDGLQFQSVAQLLQAQTVPEVEVLAAAA